MGLKFDVASSPQNSVPIYIYIYIYTKREGTVVIVLEVCIAFQIDIDTKTRALAKDSKGDVVRKLFLFAVITFRLRGVCTHFLMHP